ncbi:MAG: DUF1844 domain-containing protein [Deltaproteobacteria bacterium]|nr:DUF1844 domain-containing protein [Deltaproteobacteria bacterium]
MYGSGEGSHPDKVKETEAVSDKKDSPPPSLPPVDFSNLILSLSTSVLINLGEVPDPVTNKKDKNLEMARQTIDIIELLKDKTKGNLTEGEGKLVDAVLYDLRMRYVSASSR